MPYAVCAWRVDLMGACAFSASGGGVATLHGVFDGHGGEGAARCAARRGARAALRPASCRCSFCARNFRRLMRDGLREEPADADEVRRFRAALRTAMVQADAEVRAALAAVVRGGCEAQRAAPCAAVVRTVLLAACTAARHGGHDRGGCLRDRHAHHRSARSACRVRSPGRPRARTDTMLGCRMWAAGDSRAILVSEDGSVKQLTQDHKVLPAAAGAAWRCRWHRVALPLTAWRCSRVARMKKRAWRRWVDLCSPRTASVGCRASLPRHGTPPPPSHAACCCRENLLTCGSSAIGDAPLKPYVTAEPDVEAYAIQPSDAFVLLASDGLWCDSPVATVHRRCA